MRSGSVTVRGAKLLGEADVIIYAGSLVNPELLSYAKRDCQIYNSAHMTLEEVIEVMKEAEKDGQMTVRLTPAIQAFTGRSGNRWIS